MVDVDQTKVLKLAQQGNQQAIAVALNRHLMPKGAHIKIKHKGDCLQILLHTPQKAQQSTLIQMLRDQLLMMRPAGFASAKIYNPHPGKKTASLMHEFKFNTESIPPQFNTRPHVAPQGTTPSTSTHPSSPRRSSVAEVLLNMSSVEDLQALKKHPFFTGKCPQCGTTYIQQDFPPVYWDCQACGWVDDPSQLVPHAHVSGAVDQKTLTDSKKLGNYLMEAGLLTTAQLEVALADQKITGMRLGEVLVRRGWIKEETIEYLMEKVILPERSSSQEQSSSYVELSRKLLKTLMSQAQDPTRNIGDQSRLPPLPDLGDNRSPSERATLVLPDADVSDYLDDFPARG